MTVHAQDAENELTISRLSSRASERITSANQTGRQLVRAGRPHRQATTARPLRSTDTAMVTAITQVLETVDAVPLTTAVHESIRVQAVRPETIVVPAAEVPVSKLSYKSPYRAFSPRFTPYLKSVGWLVVICLVLGVIEAVVPVGGGMQTTRFVPIAAQVAGNPTLDLATGPWATGSGGTATLGFGGGAGPGVQAPGSAGLKVVLKQSHSLPQFQCDPQ